MYLSTILKRENNNIDLLRLLAALLVVWAHAPALFGLPAFWIPAPHGMYAGRLGVAIFFFLSGMLVCNSLVTKKNVWAFVWARFMRIYPAFFVMLIFSVFLIGPVYTTLNAGQYFSSSETWHFFFRNIILSIQYHLPGVWESRLNIGINASTWTIPIEVGCYICLLFSFLLCNKLKINHWVFFVLAMVFSIIPIKWLLPIMGINYTIIDQVDIFCFAIGAIMAVYKEQIVLDKKILSISLLICVLLWRCENVICYLYPVVVSLVLIYSTSIKPLLRLHLKHDISYGIYIWHWPICQILYTHLHSINVYIFFVIVLIITSIIAYLSAIIVEEPCIAKGRMIGKNKIAIPNNGLLMLLALLLTFCVAKYFF